jgi:uncharacterized membrane-anchored protein
MRSHLQLLQCMSPVMAPCPGRPQADLGYWVCRLISGTLGTVIGDFCSHNMGLDDAGASILLSTIVAVLFLL